MMLGWPSVTNPYLLDAAISPIPITLDQTALIAGFLMEGNAIGTLFSTTLYSNTKMAVMISHLLLMFGWMYMYIANTVLDLFVSRMIIGFANGFGLSHLGKYMQETCTAELSNTLGRLLPLSGNAGLVLVYTIGPFVSFQNLSLLSMVVPAVALIMFGCIPKNKCLVSHKQAEIRKSILQNKASYAVSECTANTEEQNEQTSFLELLTNPAILKQCGWIFLFVFAYQYGGFAAHIVYTNMIQSFVDNPYPQLASVIYASVNLLSGTLTLYVSHKIPLKLNLLLSCIICSAIMGLMCGYYYFKYELLETWEFFCWGPLVILMIYNIFMTLGLGSASPVIIKNSIPKGARSNVQKMYMIHFSLSAVLSTKLFQTLFTHVNLEVSYCFLSVVLLFAFFLILLLYDNDKTGAKEKDCESHYEATAEITKL